MHQVGTQLAARVRDALTDLAFGDELRLGGATQTIQLPFRTLSAEERGGTLRGVQRHAGRGSEPVEWPAIYAEMIAEVEREVAEERVQVAEIQCLELGDELLVGLPAEPFVELGLAIKEAAFPRRATVVGLANGMVGYVPTGAAFRRGGYETTLSTVSKLAPEAGELLVEAVVDVLAQLPS
jgi:hypothetical protein